MLLRSLESFLNAYRACNEEERLVSHLSIRYGDASPAPLFNEDDIEGFTSLCPDGADFSYTFFNENTGTARGHNLLAQDANTDYLFLMNPDVIATPLLFRFLLVPFLDVSSDVAQVEARQTPLEHPKYYDLETGETNWASGAGSLIKTCVFNQLKGYDEDSFFLYCDDVDLSARVRLLGKKIIYQPEAVIFHAKRLTSKGHQQPSAAERYYSAEAGLMMPYKWLNMRRFNELMQIFAESDDEYLVRAAETISARMKDKAMPEQVKPGYRIPVFVDGEGIYAPHRFGY